MCVGGVLGRVVGGHHIRQTKSFLVTIHLLLSCKAGKAGGRFGETNIADSVRLFLNHPFFTATVACIGVEPLQEQGLTEPSGAN